MGCEGCLKRNVLFSKDINPKLYCFLYGFNQFRIIERMNYTNLEQSKRLYELGLDPSTADMYYTIFNNNSIPHLIINPITPDSWKRLCPQVYTPCWSTGALLEVCKSFGIETINLSEFTFESLFSTVVKYLTNGKGGVLDW